MSASAEMTQAPGDAPRRQVRFAGLVVGALLLLGVAALAYGFVRHPDAITIGWHDDGRRAVAYALGVAALLAAIAAWRRWPPVPVAGAAFALFAASAVGPGAVLAVLLIAAACLQVGFLLVDDGRPVSAVRALVAAALGLAAYAALLQVMGRLPVHYPLVHSVLLLAPFALGRRTAASWRALGAALSSRPAASDIATRLLWAVAGGGLVIRFIGTLAPEVGVDAMGMHLEMPWIVARDHGWWPARTEFTWAWMPLAVNWTYALAFQLGGEPAARLLNFAADAATLALCAGVAGAWRGPRAAAVAAVIYSTLPLRYLLTTSLFVETIWSLWLGTAVLVMGAIVHGHTRRTRDFAVAGVLVGAALASKLMTAFWAPLVALFVVVAWRRGVLDVRRLAAMAAAASLVGLWPYAVAWLETGNPVFPFMNEIFRSPLMPAAPLALAPYHAGIGPATLFDATFRTDQYLEASPGGLGLSLLALLPAGLVAAAWRGGLWARCAVAGSLVFVLVCFHYTAYLRYIAPVLPIWAVLVAGGLESVLARPGRLAVALLAGVTGLAGLALSANSTWGYRFLPPLGPVDAARYRDWEDLQRPEMHMVRRINDLGLKHVLWIGRPYFVGLRARVSIESWHQNAGWTDLRTRDDLARWVAARGIDGIVITPGLGACDTVVCEALAEIGDPEHVFRSVRFWRLVPGELKPVPREPGERKPFSQERLVDAELEGSPASAWTGTGEWDHAQGVMRLSAGQHYAQRVDTPPAQSYAYILRTRCTAATGYFRTRVDWLRADGATADVHVQTFPCTADWTETRLEVKAPADAVAAVVHAAGQGAAPVEFDRVEFRQ